MSEREKSVTENTYATLETTRPHLNAPGMPASAGMGTPGT
jgi:hypothetical protein